MLGPGQILLAPLSVEAYLLHHKNCNWKARLRQLRPQVPALR